MLRVCASRAGFAGQDQSQWNNGARLKLVYPDREIPHIHLLTENILLLAPTFTLMLPQDGIVRTIMATTSGLPATVMVPPA